MDKKHWFKLGAVAVALLLLPRRSSRQAQDTVYQDTAYNDKETSNTDCTSQSVPSHPETEEKAQSDL
ncbi:hypothetical protein PSAR109036_03875 [Psychrobacter arenosus]|uniref:hypothetical protein n=1 Tax=Psychrobacter arenosus TaxID=256326 RepID=UPI001919A96B|nr:hypothetical protein [Psychrobacter arenosus]